MQMWENVWSQFKIHTNTLMVCYCFPLTKSQTSKDGLRATMTEYAQHCLLIRSCENITHLAYICYSYSLNVISWFHCGVRFFFFFLQIVSKLKEEIGAMEREHSELQQHISRTDLWCENLGSWRATITNAEVTFGLCGFIYHMKTALSNTVKVHPSKPNPRAVSQGCI